MRIDKSCHEPPYDYSLFGLHVQSDLRLPATPTVSRMESAPDVVIHLMDSTIRPEPDGPLVTSLPCSIHGLDMTEHRGPSGIWLWLRFYGTFHITPDSRTISVYRDEEIDERAPALAILGSVLQFVRHRLVSPSLHASAVVTDIGAVAFVGVPGHGKSTMAASFLRRGATLLTDDALPLLVEPDGVYGIPGPPLMKVWRETAEHTLALPEELPTLTANTEKRLFPLGSQYALADTPVRLRAIYLLHRYEPPQGAQMDISIGALTQREGLIAMMAHTCGVTYLIPAEEAISLSTYAQVITKVPVRTLRYPHGFNYQETVHARILEDLDSL